MQAPLRTVVPEETGTLFDTAYGPAGTIASIHRSPGAGCSPKFCKDWRHPAAWVCVGGIAATGSRPEAPNTRSCVGRIYSKRGLSGRYERSHLAPSESKVIQRRQVRISIACKNPHGTQVFRQCHCQPPSFQKGEGSPLSFSLAIVTPCRRSPARR